MTTFRHALVSVSDKTGLLEFLKPLVDQGLKIVSTGGTAEFLKKNGIDIIEISEWTKFPEVMGGRVKTLHPNVHMSLLSRPDFPEDLKLLEEAGIHPFDLLVVNLYPFEKEPSIEMIDIGGPSLLRGAAKNFARVTVVCDPNDYAAVLKSQPTKDQRQVLAAKVFAHVSSYDAMIARYLMEQSKSGDFPHWSYGAGEHQSLRYGENPHQPARWMRERGAKTGWQQAKVLQGKELSFNNLLDLQAALETLRDFPNEAACVAVKHNNPCGVSIGSSGLEALERALASDPVSVFGGIIAINKTVDEKMAQALSNIFLECVVAPEYSEEAVQVFSKKKNLRILVWPEMMKHQEKEVVRMIDGGLLLQSPDRVALDWSNEWKVIGETPSEKIKKDLVFAWKVCAHLKSNAIAVAGNGQSLGLGMGQVNRVDAVKHAIERFKQFHPHMAEQNKDCVLASDAFFPFSDSIEQIAQAGLRWVIQPGGSIKDQEVIKKAEELKVNLILTGQRHFRH